MPNYVPSHTYNEAAAQGVYGNREQWAQVYQSPQESGRLATLYGGQILESSGQEERIRAELQYLRDMLAEANPSMTPILVSLIKNEIARNEYDLAKLSEGVGSAAVAIAGQQRDDFNYATDLYDRAYQDQSWEPHGWGTTAPTATPNMQPMYGQFSERPQSLSSMGVEGVSGWQQSQLPSYMSGWMTPLGARPIGAQTQMGPTERSALWESIAMQKAGNVTSLQDYLSSVQPFIQMYGEQHENMSQRLQPRERQRTALWRAPSQ